MTTTKRAGAAPAFHTHPANRTHHCQHALHWVALGRVLGSTFYFHRYDPCNGLFTLSNRRHGPTHRETKKTAAVTLRWHMRPRLTYSRRITSSCGSTACPGVNFLFSSITELCNGFLTLSNRRHAPRDSKNRRSDAIMVDCNLPNLLAPNNELVRLHCVSRHQLPIFIDN